MATLTVYPDTGNPGATTVDSYVGRSTDNESLATIIAGAGNTIDSDANALYTESSTGSSANTWSGLYRSFMHFDTSPLTADASISAAVFSGVKTNNSNTLGVPGSRTFHMVQSTVVSNNTMAETDKNNVGSVDFGSISYDDFIAGSGYKDIALNAAGIANISKTGVSKFATRSQYDLNGSFGDTWSSLKSFYIAWKSSSASGTTEDPMLTITYSLGGGGTPISNLLLLGVG